MSHFKCNCLSSPDYHREDCIVYDIYGNFKNSERTLLSFYECYVYNKNRGVLLSPMGDPEIFLNKLKKFVESEKDFFFIDNNILDLTKKQSEIDLVRNLGSSKANDLWDLLLFQMVYLYNCKDTKIKDIVLNNQIYYRDDRIKPYVANTNIFLFHEDLSSFLSNELMWDELLIKDFLNNFTQTNKLMKDLESQNYHSNTFDNIINDRNRRFMSKNFIKPRLFYSYLKSYLKIKYNKKIEDL